MRRISLLLLAVVLVFSLFAQASIEKNYVVALRSANVRALPSTQGDIIHTMAPGEKAELLENLGEWLKIRLADGKIGYVWSRVVRLETVKVTKSPSPSPLRTPASSPSTSPPAPSQARFGLSFNFQYAIVNPEDFNANVETLNAYLNYLSQIPEYSSASIDHPLEGLKRLLGGGVEVNYRLNRNLGINAGLAYFTASKSSDSTLSLTHMNDTLELTYSTEFKSRISAPYIGLSFTLPSRFVELETFGNVAFLMGNFYHQAGMESRLNSAPLDSYWEKYDNMKKSTVGFMAGANLRFKFNEKMGIYLGGKYILANFKDLEGDYSNAAGESLHGNVYRVEISFLGIGTRPVLYIATEPPSDHAIVKVQRAKFNFSGFYFNLGFFSRF